MKAMRLLQALLCAALAILALLMLIDSLTNCISSGCTLTS